MLLYRPYSNVLVSAVPDIIRLLYRLFCFVSARYSTFVSANLKSISLNKIVSATDKEFVSALKKISESSQVTYIVNL